MRSRFVFYFLTFLLFPGTSPQAQPPCFSLKPLPVSISVYLGGQLQQDTIRLRDLTERDLEIRVSDSVIRLTGFTLCYDCHSGLRPDINCMDYPGSVIKAGDPFLSYIRAGDFLEFSCLMLSREGQLYRAAGPIFRITGQP